MTVNGKSAGGCDPEFGEKEGAERVDGPEPLPPPSPLPVEPSSPLNTVSAPSSDELELSPDEEPVAVDPDVPESEVAVALVLPNAVPELEPDELEELPELVVADTGTRVGEGLETEVLALLYFHSQPPLSIATGAASRTSVP